MLLFFKENGLVVKEQIEKKAGGEGLNPGHDMAPNQLPVLCVFLL